MEAIPDQNTLADELLIIRHSGEIPEVALHGSIFFLTRDPQGPKLTLDEGALIEMKKKVVARYREMIIRDLEPKNRDKTIYRGMARCVVNWQRMSRFCSRENFALDPIRLDVAKRLILFIKNENDDVGKGRKSSLNCCKNTLGEFAEKLGIEAQELPAGWQDLCPKKP